MKWKGLASVIKWVEATYDKGVRLTPQQLASYQPFWHRSTTLPPWDITVITA